MNLILSLVYLNRWSMILHFHDAVAWHTINLNREVILFIQRIFLCEIFMFVCVFIFVCFGFLFLVFGFWGGCFCGGGGFVWGGGWVGGFRGVLFFLHLVYCFV